MIDSAWGLLSKAKQKNDLSVCTVLMDCHFLINSCMWGRFEANRVETFFIPNAIAQQTPGLLCMLNGRINRSVQSTVRGHPWITIPLPIQNQPSP